MAAQSLPSPAPDELSECEIDLAAELDRKRHHIDEEIASFKAQKEREFHDFENDLRRKRKHTRSPSSKHRQTVKPAIAPSVLSLLAANSKPQGNGITHKKKGSDGLVSSNSKAPPSKPTLSLDKLNINGTTTPPVVGTPPANANALTKTLSRSPSNMHIALTPPRPGSLTKYHTTPAKDRNDTTLAGLFTPAYLPLLDSEPLKQPVAPSQPKEQKPPQSQSEPALPLSSEVSPVPKPESLSSSAPHQVSPTMLSTTAKRSMTAPSLPSTSLASALRTASGTSMRKRKKVTFQLSDSAIVEPSSSYEELPSPAVPDGGTSGQVEIDGMEEMVKEDIRLGSADTVRADTERNVDTGLGSAQVEVSPIQLTVPKQRESRLDSTGSSSATEIGAFSGGLQEADDGGSGVGFFELDEELESPGIGEASPYSHVEDGEVDDVLEEPGGGKKGEGARGKETRSSGDGNGGVKHASFTSGSVPIDIVNRASSSWFGSYGH